MTMAGVRLMVRAMISLGCVLGMSAVYWQGLTSQVLPLRERSAKAKLLLQEVVDALGGQAFREVRDSDCQGQMAEFDHNSEVIIYAPFRELLLLPDKSRMEYSFKGQVLIAVISGEKAWMLDKTGISDQPDNAINSVAQEARLGMYSTLRSLPSDAETLQFYYAGKDSIDLKAVDWIESDRYDRELRLAIEESTHLPVRWVVSSKDPTVGEPIEEVTSYAQFVATDGVQTPHSISYTLNGRLISQISVSSCRYNVNLSPEMFTMTALEERQREVSNRRTKKGDSWSHRDP
jgi:hypothetical protein